MSLLQFRYLEQIIHVSDSWIYTSWCIDQYALWISWRRAVWQIWRCQPSVGAKSVDDVQEVSFEANFGFCLWPTLQGGFQGLLNGRLITKPLWCDDLFILLLNGRQDTNACPLTSICGDTETCICPLPQASKHPLLTNANKLETDWNKLAEDTKRQTMFFC